MALREMVGYEREMVLYTCTYTHDKIVVHAQLTAISTLVGHGAGVNIL